MSDSDQIFIATRLSPIGVARHIAALGWTVDVDGGGRVFVTRVDRSTEFGGLLGQNIHRVEPGEPGDASVLDDYDLMWDLDAVPTVPEARRLALAREALVALVASADWPMLLVHDLDLLVAGRTRGGAVQEVPVGTTVDLPHAERWRSFVPDR